MNYPTHHHKPDFFMILMLFVVIGLTVTVAVQFNVDPQVEKAPQHVVISSTAPVLAQI